MLLGREEKAGKQAGHESVKGWTVKATVYPVVPLPVQEWEVIKVNKRGRRQLRVMGIDLSRITNKKVEKRRFGSNETYRVRQFVHARCCVAPPPSPQPNQSWVLVVRMARSCCCIS